MAVKLLFYPKKYVAESWSEAAVGAFAGLLCIIICTVTTNSDIVRTLIKHHKYELIHPGSQGSDTQTKLPSFDLSAVHVCNKETHRGKNITSQEDKMDQYSCFKSGE